METGSRIKFVWVIVVGLGLALSTASGGQAQVIHPDQIIGIPSPSSLEGWRENPPSRQ